MSTSYSNLKIMLIDDDEDDVFIFAEVLQSIDEAIGFDTAHSCTDALKMLSVEHQLPDLIFLDINMPVLNGFECLVEMKKDPKLSGIPVIMYSTAANAGTIQTAKLLGAVYFFNKPSNHIVLKSRLVEIFSEYLKK